MLKYMWLYYCIKVSLKSHVDESAARKTSLWGVWVGGLGGGGEVEAASGIKACLPCFHVP